MHSLISFIAATTTTVATTKKSHGSNYALIFIVLIFGAVYLLFLRPRQQRMRQQQTAARQLSIGDQVVSAGGIQGTLVGLTDDSAEVEVAPGVVMTFLRRSVSVRPGSTSATAPGGSGGSGGAAGGSAGSAGSGGEEPVSDEWELPPGHDHPDDENPSGTTGSAH